MVQAKPKRRFPWRWAGALATAIVVGVGCAFAVMAPPHTDLPGLKTPSDRRYVFAPLSLPTLAPGQLPPGDLANTGEQHMADIRKLLLPAPQGAVTTDGTETKIYLLQFSNERNAASALIMLGEMAGEPKDAATSLFMLGSTPLMYSKDAQGTSNIWYGTTLVHDTVLEIVYAAPSAVGETPFRQEFSLQTELLE